MPEHFTHRGSLLLGTGMDLTRGKAELVAENAFLRQQLIMLRRQIKRPTYRQSDRILLMLSGGEHMLGGVTGYDAVETTDENPERVATIQRLTLAYLRSTLYSGDPAWSEACAAFAVLKELGHIESK